MKFPIYIRVVLVPVRIIVFTLAVGTVGLLLMGLNENDKFDSIIDFILEYGN